LPGTFVLLARYRNPANPNAWSTPEISVLVQNNQALRPIFCRLKIGKIADLEIRISDNSHTVALYGP